jgi:hypothetical protein
MDKVRILMGTWGWLVQDARSWAAGRGTVMSFCAIEDDITGQSLSALLGIQQHQG